MELAVGVAHPNAQVCYCFRLQCEVQRQFLLEASGRAILPSGPDPVSEGDSLRPRAGSESGSGPVDWSWGWRGESVQLRVGGGLCDDLLGWSGGPVTLCHRSASGWDLSCGWSLGPRKASQGCSKGGKAGAGAGPSGGYLCGDILRVFSPTSVTRRTAKDLGGHCHRLLFVQRSLVVGPRLSDSTEPDEVCRTIYTPAVAGGPRSHRNGRPHNVRGVH